jgi:hypothetical protein
VIHDRANQIVKLQSGRFDWLSGAGGERSDSCCAVDSVDGDVLRGFVLSHGGDCCSGGGHVGAGASVKLGFADVSGDAGAVAAAAGDEDEVGLGKRGPCCCASSAWSEIGMGLPLVVYQRMRRGG